MKTITRLLILFLSVSGICVFWGEEVLQYVLPQQQRSCACDRCLFENDTLAIQNISRFPQPLLSRKYNLSEEDFNWWKRLQPGGGSISDYRKKIEKVFQLIPDNPPLEASSPGYCRTCAVVGNSRNLLKSHYGPLIDFQDYVIRKPLFNKDLVMVLNPAFMTNIHKVWLKRKGACPSTGFMALVLSLHICDEVHVFGFGADSDGNWSHYWEQITYKRLRTGRHPGNVEYKMIEELTKHQVLKFYKGW